MLKWPNKNKPEDSVSKQPKKQPVFSESDTEKKYASSVMPKRPLLRNKRKSKNVSTPKKRRLAEIKGREIKSEKEKEGFFDFLGRWHER